MAQEEKKCGPTDRWYRGPADTGHLLQISLYQQILSLGTPHPADLGKSASGKIFFLMQDQVTENLGKLHHSMGLDGMHSLGCCHFEGTPDNLRIIFCDCERFLRTSGKQMSLLSSIRERKMIHRQLSLTFTPRGWDSNLGNIQRYAGCGQGQFAWGDPDEQMGRRICSPEVSSKLSPFLILRRHSFSSTG